MSSKTPSDIAVIIVNYGTADLTIAGVESVLSRQHGGHPVEIHVVDNPTPEAADAALLRAAHAQGGWGGRVTLWLEHENHGFGRGNNVALKALAAREQPPRYAFLLNPDAQLENEALAILADFLDQHPEVAMAGAGIAKPDSGPVTAAFRFPSAASEFAQAVNFGPLARAFKTRLVPLPPATPAGPVGWVAGAAVMMRFDAIRAVGFFDPTYFLYYEEVDLMLQVQRAGYQIWYLPQARVLHSEGAATGVQSAARRRRRPQYWYQSWRHYYAKNHGRAGAIGAGLAWMGGAALNEILARLRGQVPHAPQNFYGDFWGTVMRPLLGLPEAPRG